MGLRTSLVMWNYCFNHLLGFRLKAGLKLHEEAEKREVEKGIHLLRDPESKAARCTFFLLSTYSVAFLVMM